VPTLTHEDIRYYTLGKGGFCKRTGYALSRAVVTRSDSNLLMGDSYKIKKLQISKGRFKFLERLRKGEPPLHTFC
jgi:hypothetical protein